jgi:hypothetical protein
MMAAALTAPDRLRRSLLIVQSAPAGEPHFVITLSQHTAFAAAMARVFGNDAFEPPSPRAEMLYVIEHHDQGWAEFDERPQWDPETGLPYHLGETPRETALATAVRSPELNEAHHPYCGLLSSMHIWGLYMGRYGLSEGTRLLEGVPAEYRARFEAMLDGQLERQARLKAVLAADPATAGWIEERKLFQNYKQLQFFDTLTLYFQCTRATDRGPAEFLHVPKSAEEDVTVAVTPMDADTYRFSPFPWSEDGVEVSFEGRYFTPDPDATGAERYRTLRNAATETQTVRFVA